jgi:glycopeptide antibiotics resistance protein
MRAIIVLLKKKKLVELLFVIYLLMLFRLTVFRFERMFPLKWMQGSLMVAPWGIYWAWIKTRNWYWILVEVVGNVVGFFPLGGYLGWKKVPLWKIALLGFLCSLSIELAQYVLGVGCTDVGDLIHNTLGTFLGGWLVKESQWDARRRKN